MRETYLIWSEEHGAWWAPHGYSYTRSIEEAGRFNEKRAREIVAQANLAIHKDSGINPGRTFNEIPILEPVAWLKEEERRREEYADESDRDF